MAKRKIIWSNTAKKKLYAIFESDIIKGNGKKQSIDLFRTISKNLKHLKNDPETGMKTTHESINGMKVMQCVLLYSFTMERIYVHTISVL